MKANAKLDVPAGPPLPQEQCLLFGLPAEIRNYIYELALDVGKNDSGKVVLKRRLHGNKDTVLNLLSVCRLIHQEAAGIFYSQHKITIDWRILCANSDHGISSPSLVTTLSRQRLKGLRSLTVICQGGFENGLEYVTMACNRVRTLRDLQTLCFTLERRNRIHQWDVRVNVEIPFLKKAVRKLKSVRELRFEIEHVEDREVFMERLDAVVAELPHNARAREEPVDGYGPLLLEAAE